jgi:hypothetical protein
MFFVDGTIEKITVSFDSSSTDLPRQEKKKLQQWIIYQ